MSGKWNPTNHTISDFKDWDNDSKLVIQPDFQRKAGMELNIKSNVN